MKSKKNLIKTALVLIATLIISTLALTSCSSDTEPDVPSQDMSYIPRYAFVFLNGDISDINRDTCVLKYFVEGGEAEHDYISITFIPDENITLLDESPVIVEYPGYREIVECYLEFDIELAFNEMLPQNLRDIEVGRIRVRAEAYKDGKVVDEYKCVAKDSFYALATPYGVFWGSALPGNIKLNYLQFLYDNGYITYSELCEEEIKLYYIEESVVQDVDINSSEINISNDGACLPQSHTDYSLIDFFRTDGDVAV